MNKFCISCHYSFVLYPSWLAVGRCRLYYNRLDRKKNCFLKEREEDKKTERWSRRDIELLALRLASNKVFYLCWSYEFSKFHSCNDNSEGITSLRKNFQEKDFSYILQTLRAIHYLFLTRNQSIQQTTSNVRPRK